MAEPVFDAKGFERREACLGLAACPVCGKELTLVAETESWVEGPDGLWLHDSYGPSQGVCCDTLVVDSWDGCRAYDLSRSKEKG